MLTNCKKSLSVDTIVALFSGLVNISLAIYALYLKFNDLSALGSASILILISFFSGVILFTLGITGIYIARIFEQVRGRDRYIIKEIKKNK